MSKLQNIPSGARFNIYASNITNVNLLERLSSGNLPSNSIIINAEADSASEDTYIDFAITDNNGLGSSILPNEIVKYDDTQMSISNKNLTISSFNNVFSNDEYLTTLNNIVYDLYGLQDFNTLCSYYAVNHRLPLAFNIHKKLKFINAANNNDIKSYLLTKTKEPYTCHEGTATETDVLNVVITDILSDGKSIFEKYDKDTDTHFIFDKCGITINGTAVNSASTYRLKPSDVYTKFPNLTFACTITNDKGQDMSETINDKHTDLQDALKKNINTIINDDNTDMFDRAIIHQKWKYSWDIRNTRITCTIDGKTHTLNIINGISETPKDFTVYTTLGYCPDSGYVDIKFPDGSGFHNDVFVSGEPIPSPSIYIHNTNTPIFGNNSPGIKRISDSWHMRITSTQNQKSNLTMALLDNIVNKNNISMKDDNDTNGAYFVYDISFVKNSQLVTATMPIVTKKIYPRSADDRQETLACELESPVYTEISGDGDGNSPIKWLIYKPSDNEYARGAIGKYTFNLKNQYIKLSNCITAKSQLITENRKDRILRACTAQTKTNKLTLDAIVFDISDSFDFNVELAESKIYDYNYSQKFPYGITFDMDNLYDRSKNQVYIPFLDVQLSKDNSELEFKMKFKIDWSTRTVEMPYFRNNGSLSVIGMSDIDGYLDIYKRMFFMFDYGIHSNEVPLKFTNATVYQKSTNTLQQSFINIILPSDNITFAVFDNDKNNYGGEPYKIYYTDDVTDEKCDTWLIS